MAHATCNRSAAQSPELRTVVADTARRRQRARERLELQALNLGADHVLAQVAADAWLREVLL